MRAKAYLAVLAVIVAISLAFLAACGPATPTPAPPAIASAPAAVTAPPTAAASIAPTAAPTAASKPAAPSPTSAPKIKRGGTLREITQDAPDVLDPHFNSGGCGECITTIFDGMFFFEPDPSTGFLAAAPELVSAWEFPNPTTAMFKIRPGVKFQDGSVWDAEGLRYNLDRMMNHRRSRQKTSVEDIKSVEVVDSQTVKVNLKGASAALLANLAPLHIVPKETAEKGGEDAFARRPVGTGPFEFVEWIEGSKMTVKRSETYWDKGADGQSLPYIDGVVIRIIPDTAVAMLEFKARTADILDEFEPKDFATIKSDPELGYYELDYLVRTIPAVGYNQFKPPFDNVKLRQATQWATDKDAMAKTLGFGLASPVYYPWWAKGLLGYDEGVPKYTFDQNKAKQLLREAGYADGVDVTLSVVSRAAEQRASEMIKNMWDAVGIRTNLQVVERVALFSKMAAMEFEAGVWRGDSPLDPDVNRKRLATGGTSNRSMMSDPALDRCLEEGRAEFDPKKRHEIYKKCQTILYEGAYSLHGYAVKVNRVHHKSVKGFRDKGTTMLFREIWLDR